MIVFPLLFLLLVGLSIITIFNLFPKSTFYEKLAFSYGLGISCITLQLLVFSIIHLEWSRVSILLPWSVLIFFAGIKHRGRGIHLFNQARLPKSFFGKLIISLLTFLTLFVFFEAQLRPVPAWDAWANWFLGGKAYYILGFVDPNFIQYAGNSSPPVINLFISFFLILLGGTDDRFILLGFACFYVFILILFYSTLKSYIKSDMALVFTFLLATVPNLIRHGGKFDVGHADLPLSYFFLASTVLLLYFLKTKSIRILLLLNIFLGTGALVKSEGIPFLIIMQVVTAFFIVKWQEYKKMFLFFFGLFPAICWQIFKFYYDLPENPFISGGFHIERLNIIFFEAVKEFFNVIRWNFLWLFFIISVFLMKWKNSVVILFIILAFQMFVYLLIYVTTPLDPVSHMHNSFDRLLLHLAPITMLFVAINIGRKVEQVIASKK